MKIKKSYIIISILFLLMIISMQAISAENNATLNNKISAEDVGEELGSEDKFDIPTSVNVNSTKKVEIKINTTQDVVKNDLKLKLNQSGAISDISDFELVDKTIKFSLNNDFSKDILHVTFKDKNYSTTLNKIININIEPLKFSAPYQIGNYTFKVTDIDTNEFVKNKSIIVKVPINGPKVYYTAQQQITTDTNGIATFYLNKIYDPNLQSENLQVGDHEITITGDGQLKGTNKTTIRIEKLDVVLTTSTYKQDKGSNEKFTIKVTSKQTGEAIKGVPLLLNIEHTEKINYTVTTTKEGIATITFDRLNVGEYDAIISTMDNNLNKAQTTSKIIINKIKVKITVESTAKYFNTGNTAIIKVTNMNGEAEEDVPVQFSVAGKSYTYKTNKAGKIVFTTYLNAGTHTITFDIVGSIYTGSSVSKKLSIKKATGKLSISTKTTYYNSGKYSYVKIINTVNKKPIYNAKIQVKVKVTSRKTYTYTGTTSLWGKMNFNNNLKPGTYKITVESGDLKNFKTKALTLKMTVKKSPLKLKTKTTKKQLQISVINKKSKLPVPGVKLKVKVFTGSKSKIFSSKSNSNGICKLNLKSIKNGIHKVVISTSNPNYILKSYTAKIKING